MRTSLVIPALLASACATARPPAAPAALSFIEDDFPRALAQAKASGRPLFVDAWAPW